MAKLYSAEMWAFPIIDGKVSTQKKQIWREIFSLFYLITKKYNDLDRWLNLRQYRVVIEIQIHRDVNQKTIFWTKLIESNLALSFFSSNPPLPFRVSRSSFSCHPSKDARYLKIELIPFYLQSCRGRQQRAGNCHVPEGGSLILCLPKLVNHLQHLHVPNLSLPGSSKCSGFEWDNVPQTWNPIWKPKNKTKIRCSLTVLINMIPVNETSTVHKHKSNNPRIWLLYVCTGKKSHNKAFFIISESRDVLESRSYLNRICSIDYTNNLFIYRTSRRPSFWLTTKTAVANTTTYWADPVGIHIHFHHILSISI